MIQTGSIWEQSPRSRGQICRRVCERLEEEYGRPRHGNPENPLEDLVYVLLSNRTPPERAGQVYETFRERFPDWQTVLDANREEIVDVLEPAGFANRRTDQIRSFLSQLKENFGSFEAPTLWEKEDDELLAYLTTFRGVSDKVARCVMMYALGRDVLPVDVHVHRVASRLGWTGQDRPERAHEELEALIPSHRYHAFHVDCVAHGRSRCTASNPECEGCPIRRYCKFAGGPLAPTKESK